MIPINLLIISQATPWPPPIFIKWLRKFYPKSKRHPCITQFPKSLGKKWTGFHRASRKESISMEWLRRMGLICSLTRLTALEIINWSMMQTYHHCCLFLTFSSYQQLNLCTSTQGNSYCPLKTLIFSKIKRFLELGVLTQALDQYGRWHWWLK